MVGAKLRAVKLPFGSIKQQKHKRRQKVMEI